MNRSVLSATLVEKKAKRFTPAGLPVLECQVHHESQVLEAAAMRTVGFECRVKAVGDIAERVEQLVIGSVLTMTGFLAPARQHSKQLIFHITDFELE
ncbi:MAG: primosomal replication protein N [Burkholderiaceae bacterium]|nr:primosomal replication protein N [Burkholderiaceae bacterium]